MVGDVHSLLTARQIKHAFSGGTKNMKTSRVKNQIFVVAALCLLSSVAAFAQKTNVDWDRQADFSKFHTYAWQKSPHPASRLWDQRVIDGVDRQLAAKGFTKVEQPIRYMNASRSERHKLKRR
jgi:hypothetical protein